MSPAMAGLAALACGVGALVRYGLIRLGSQSQRQWPWPWPTLAANVLGSALLGTTLAAATHSDLHSDWLLILGGGTAGSLSTFSTLAVDILELWHDGRRRAMVIYLTLTLVGGLAAAGAAWAGTGALVS